MAKPAVAVIGASNDRSKFGNKAVRAFLAQGYDVYPVNPKEREIEGLKSYPTVAAVPAALDKITLYLPPQLGIKVLDDIARKGAKEFFVNPGAESDDLVARAKALGLKPLLACSIVAIGRTPAEFA